MADDRDPKVYYSFIYSFKPGDELERSDFTDVMKQKHHLKLKVVGKGASMKVGRNGCARVGSACEACRGAS